MSSRRKFRRGGDAPPCFDPAFVDALNQQPNSHPRRSAKADQKASQLCRQARRALHLAFGGIGDPALSDVVVLDVIAGHGNALIVQIALPTDMPWVEVLEALGRATPRLRAAVAESITRKRTPELIFLPAPTGMQS